MTASLVYKCTVPASASGQAYIVTSPSGATVASGVVGAADASGDVVTIRATLPEGTYSIEGLVAAWAGAFEPVMVVDWAASINAGAGASETARGTLYLKASCVDADASTETWADGTGSPLALVLDTDRQGSSPIPTWAQDDGGVFTITEAGGYIAQIAAIGSVTYDVEPASVYIDLGHPTVLGGANWGWDSAGTDDADAFPVDVTTALPFGHKESTVIGVSRDDVPLSLAGLEADNFGPLTDNPKVSVDVLWSVTRLGSGVRYTEADFA